MPSSSRFARNCLRAFAAVCLVVPAVCAALDTPRSQAMEPGDGPVRASTKKLPVVDTTGIYEQGMSGFGLLARMAATGRLDAALAKARAPGGGASKGPPVIEEDDGTLIPGGQAEFSIAVDATGNNVWSASMTPAASA